MARVTSIFVNIGANTDGFKKEITGLQKTLNASLGKGGMGFSKAAVGVLAGISAGLGLVGFSAVKSAAGMEMTRTAFTQMLGSAEKAESFIKDLQKFAASTPFEFEQVELLLCSFSILNLQFHSKYYQHLYFFRDHVYKVRYNSCKTYRNHA